MQMRSIIISFIYIINVIHFHSCYAATPQVVTSNNLVNQNAAPMPHYNNSAGNNQINNTGNVKPFNGNMQPNWNNNTPINNNHVSQQYAEGQKYRIC